MNGTNESPRFPWLALERLFTNKRLEAFGWAIRIILILAIFPMIHLNLFVPFIEQFILQPSIDPWATWLDSGGAPQAFPYGHIMLLYHALFVAAGIGLEALVGGFPSYLSGRGGQLGFAVSILFADYLLFQNLKAWLCKDKRELGRLDRDNPATAKRKVVMFLLYFYWLSPLVIYINYIHGQTDVVPTLLVTLALINLQKRYYYCSGFFLAVAFSVKASVALVFPFLVFAVIFQNSSYRTSLRWFTSLALGLAFWALISLILPGQVEMVLQNHELAETLRAGMVIVEGRELLFFPLVYGAFIAALVFMAPMDRWTLYTLTGVTLLSIMIVSSTSVGWYYWALPFLLYAVLFSSLRLKIIVAGFWIVVALKDVTLTHSLHTQAFFSLADEMMLSAFLSTIIVGMTLLLAFKLLQNVMQHNPNYTIIKSRRFIGISGDSSSGKDTLVDTLVMAFGQGRTGIVLGDDYHLYPRGARMWRALTHLNPRANNLSKFNEDILSLMDGGDAFTHHYDHGTGTFTRPRRLKSKQVTLVNGLHSLLDADTVRRYDLSVFMDMDEDLRRALKLARDTAKRGKTRKGVMDSILARVPDGEAYIRPQRNYADLTLSLSPLPGFSPEKIMSTTNDLNHDTRLCIEVTSKTSSDLEWFSNIIMTLTTVAVYELIGDAQSDARPQKTFRYYGSELSINDITELAQRTLGPVFELLSDDYRFDEGHRGLMQIITLYELEANLVKSSSKPYDR